MEKLLDMAKRVSAQAEVYSLDEAADGISFENAKLKDIGSRIQSGVSLRIIQNGRLGFAYTKTLSDRQGLLRNAIDSLKGGVEAPFDLPQTRDLPRLNTYDASIETLTNATLVEECQRVTDLLSSRTKGQINLSAMRQTSRIRLINSCGSDLSLSSSMYSFGAEILFPGSYSAIHRPLVQKCFEKVPEGYIRFVIDLYNASSREARVQPGKMEVLFLPETLYVLMWRLQSGTNGRNVYQKVSPLLGKVGEQLFDKKVTVCDDPLNDQIPGARAFDDEGTPCGSLKVVEEGVFKTFYYDLFYAKKMNVPPTGHGFRGSMWGGETVSFKPGPSLTRLHIRPGEKSFQKLVASMDRGVIVAGAMGAHSGNILNGEFSVGLSPGLVVEKGEIVGHVKDAMVAGNAFETLRSVVALEDSVTPSYSGVFPAMLFQDVSVATKA